MYGMLLAERSIMTCRDLPGRLPPVLSGAFKKENSELAHGLFHGYHDCQLHSNHNGTPQPFSGSPSFGFTMSLVAYLC